MRHFLLCLLLFISYQLSAQVTFELAEGDALVEVNPAQSFILSKALLTNSSNQTKALKWVKRQKKIPTEWEIALGDDNFTYSPTQLSNIFFLGPGESTYINVYLYPNGFVGIGELDVLIRDADTDELISKVNFTYREARMNNTLQAETVKIYPNPAIDHFVIETAANVGKVEIYNVIADRVRTIYSYQRQFPIGDLDPGMYFVRILGIDDQVIKTIRLKKQ